MSSNNSHTLVRNTAVLQGNATSDSVLGLAESMLYTSAKLESGSPSVYKLPMREEMRRAESMIAKQSIGQPCRIGRGESEKVFMLVGATGAGKTTLINGMVNYILGVQWIDDIRFKVITEETKASEAYSQTQEITAYTFHPMKGSDIPYTFTIIDTPGFGGTEGLQRDKKITEQIKEFFSIPPPDGIDHLDGIGFVVQASQARLTSTQEYIFSSITSIFGNDISKNIFMMITFADDQNPPVLEVITKAKIPNHSKKYFTFNNSGLFADNNNESGSPLAETFWKINFRSFKTFFEEFPKAESISLNLTRQVLDERERLHVLIEGLGHQITRGMNILEEMRQEKNVLQQHKKDIETNKEFTYTVNVTKPFRTRLKETGLHTTTCEPCHTTCHTNCPITDDAVKHKCLAMDEDGNCRICPGKCKWSVHKHFPYLIQYETITETRTSEHLKKKYEKSVQLKASSEQMIKSIKKSLQKVHVKVRDNIKTAQESLRRLDKIALKSNPITQVEYLELLIESEKREAKPSWKERIQYLEAVKSDAELLFKVKNEKESQKLVKALSSDGDVSEERKPSGSLEELSHGEDNFYSRFKWGTSADCLE